MKALATVYCLVAVLHAALSLDLVVLQPEYSAVFVMFVGIGVIVACVYLDVYRAS